MVRGTSASVFILYCSSALDSTESSNVVLTVVRSGALGTVMVYWMTGLRNSTIANGTITPDRGSFQMNPTDISAQIVLTVCDVYSRHNELPV